MPKSSLSVSLKGADDIFSTEESRQEQQREQVQQIPIGELFPFKTTPLRSWMMNPCNVRWKAWNSTACCLR